MKVIVSMIQLVLNTFFECLKTLNPHLNLADLHFFGIFFPPLMGIMFEKFVYCIFKIILKNKEKKSMEIN